MIKKKIIFPKYKIKKIVKKDNSEIIKHIKIIEKHIEGYDRLMHSLDERNVNEIGEIKFDLKEEHKKLKIEFNKLKNEIKNLNSRIDHISEYVKRMGKIQNEITKEFEDIHSKILERDHRIKDLVININKKF